MSVSVAVWQPNKDVVVSETTVYELIRKWRIARLNRDQDLLDYPRINILHPEHGIGQGDENEVDTDVELIQRMVEGLPRDVRQVFEAFHLGVIRGEYCRQMPHARRWALLGIDRSTYRSRERTARQRLRRDLLTFFGGALP